MGGSGLENKLGIKVWSNYSDLTRPHLKWWFSKGNPLISGKSRLVKYYNLASKVVDLAPKNMFVNNPPEMVFLSPDLNICDSPGFGGLDFSGQIYNHGNVSS